MNWLTTFTKPGMLLDTPFLKNSEVGQEVSKLLGKHLGDGLNCTSLLFLGYQMPLFNTVVTEG